MGLILKPAEIKNCAEQMRSQMESNRNSYAGALQTVQKFAENDSFKSESWDTMKGKVFESHQLISRGMVAVDDSMLRDFDTMESILEGDEQDEDWLMKTIMHLEEECIWYETSIQTLLKQKASLPPAPFSSIDRYIKLCREMLEGTKKELELAKEMLNDLYDKTEKTSGLFQTIGTLLGAIECAISDAQVYISGRGTPSDESWRMVIPEMVEEYYAGKCVSDLENFLYKELEITIDEFKGLYGEEVISNICESINATGIGGIDGKSRDEVITIILEQTSGQKIAKVDDKYQFLYGANKVMLEFEQDKVGEIIMDVAYANVDVKKRYIAGYLREHLPNCNNIHIAAIMGNMYQESKFSPLKSQKYSTSDLYNPEYMDKFNVDDNKGWGIIQWAEPSRKKGFLQYIKENEIKSDDLGKNPLGDMDTQLDYLIYEMKEGICKGTDKALVEIQDLETATRFFCDEVEIAGDSGKENRITYASKIYEELEMWEEGKD